MASETGRRERSISLRAKILIAVGIGLVVLLAVIGAMVLLAQNSDLTRTVRDLFLIALALEFMIVGAAMVVLMVQLARLILLLDLEVRPMLENANDTLNTLRGTSLFLTENLVEPVVQLNSSLAGIQRVLEVFGLFRKSP